MCDGRGRKGMKGQGNSHVTGTSWSVDGKRETHNLKGMIDTDTGLLSEKTGPLLNPVVTAASITGMANYSTAGLHFVSWLYRVDRRSL